MLSQSKSHNDSNDCHGNTNCEEKDNGMISQLWSLFQSAVHRKDEYVFLAVNRSLGKHTQSGTHLGTKFIQQNPDIIKKFENFCDIYRSQVTLSNNEREVDTPSTLSEFDTASTLSEFDECTIDPKSSTKSSNVTPSFVVLSATGRGQRRNTSADTSDNKTSISSRSDIPSPVDCPSQPISPDVSGSTPCNKSKEEGLLLTDIHSNVILPIIESVPGENIVVQEHTRRKQKIVEENVTKPPLRRSNRKAKYISTSKMSHIKTRQSKSNNLVRQKKTLNLTSKCSKRPRVKSKKGQGQVIESVSTTYLEDSVMEENRKADDKDNEEDMSDENDKEEGVACESEPAVGNINLNKGDNCHAQTNPADDKEMAYNCKDCDVKFSKYTEYYQHYKATHTGKNDLVCQNCGYLCTSKRSLLFHNATVHNIVTLKTKYDCASCNQSFSVKEIYEHHVMKHDFGDKMTIDGKDLVCLICLRKFRKNTAFRKHMNLHKNTNMHENFTCQVCAKVCKTDETFKYHMRLHLPEEDKPFHCQTCNKGFPTKQSYVKHQACHSDTKAFICDLCGKGFKQKKLLDIHIRRHTGERPYKCPECPQTFRCSDNCREHQLSTHRQTKEVCDICGHVCPSKHRLWQHRWRHNQKSWCCEVCGKEFKGRANYLKHYTSLHLSEDKISSFPHKIHKCEYCLKLFNSKNGYRIHLRIHTGEKPHVCHFCGKGFAEKGNLNAHLKIHLDDKKFECTVCQKRFIHNRTLKKHLEASHSKQLNDKESDSTDYDIQHMSTNFTPSKDSTSYLNIADHSTVTEGNVGYASLVTTEGKDAGQITLAETTKKSMGLQGNVYNTSDQEYRADLYPPVSVYGIDGVVWNSNNYIQSEAEQSVTNISQTMMIL